MTCARPRQRAWGANHPIYRVRGFEIVGPYVLRVAFDDDTVQTIDFEPILAGELFGPLRDPVLFRQVALDPEVHTLVSPNGADFPIRPRCMTGRTTCKPL